jgi:hypothetical protein
VPSKNDRWETDSHFSYRANYDGEDMAKARPMLSHGDKEHVWIYQDEAVYHSNDFQNASFWLKFGEHVLKKKGQGQLIMVSAFVCERYGNLALPEDLVEANARLPPSECLEFTDSRAIIYPTSKKGGDDYWNAKQMLCQVRTHECASVGV